MAPGAEVLKRQRSRPSDWWAASSAASTSTPLQQEKSAPTTTPARAPAPALKAPTQSRKKQTEAAPVPEREGLKRKRSRPSDWWAASPSISQLQDSSGPSKGIGSSSGKRTVRDVPSAENRGNVTKAGGEDKPVRKRRLSNGEDELQSSEGRGTRKKVRSDVSQVEEPQKEQAVAKKRGRHVADEQEKEQDAPKKRGRHIATQKQEVEEAVATDRPGRRGRIPNTEAEVQETVRPMAKDTEKKTKTGRLSGSSAEKQSSIEESAKDKTKKKKPGAADMEEETRGRRRTRRSDADIHEQPPIASPQENKGRPVRHSGEIVGVETASSTFGKSRARPEKNSTTEAAPRPSRSKNHAEQSSSGPSKKSGHATAKVKEKTTGRSSNTENLGSKRKTAEKPKDDPPNAKGRRVSGAVQREEKETQRQEKPPEYQHLSKVTRNVPHHAIEEKWTPLPADCIELISQLLSDVQKPVIARFKKEQNGSQASSILQRTTHRLANKLSRGLPFPQGTRPQREDDFNFEKILDHNRALEAQLTPAIHANELLEDELSKEETWLESEKAILAELEANAKSAAVSRKDAKRKLHPQLRSENSTMEGEDLEFSQHAAVPISGLFEDENLEDIVKGIENHMDSMQGNLKQVEGVSDAITKSKAAVQATLLDHLDTSRYEEVVLGLE